MEVRRFRKEDADGVMKIMEIEGEEWKDYWGTENAEMYRSALEKSITYVADSDGEICGYSRSVDDFAREVIVVDLLVTSKHRGKNIGSQLMEVLYNEFPNKEIYVMSDVDIYYEKQGYEKVGSVFEVTKRK